MTPEDAIKTAIVYEKKVLQAYRDAVNESKDAKSKKFYQLMADEEFGHVQYLEAKLAEWERCGDFSESELSTAIPTAQHISEALDRMKAEFDKEKRSDTYGCELERLRRAQALEEETSAFYRKMVDEMPEERRGLFRRFLEIEEGHKAVVQAEIDAVEGFGFWFDAQEFSMEIE